MAKVAVVTGSNKGIGFATVRGLCKQFSGDVYLTSRDEGRGKAAVAELNKEGLQPKFHQLDIEDTTSVERLKAFLVEKYGGLDILINNAGFAFKGSATEPFAEQAEVSVRINYLGTVNVLNAMMPILKPGARVVNVSSFVSRMALNKCSSERKTKLLSCKSIDDVTQAMQQFVSACKSGTNEKEGWPGTAYGTSKVGVSLLTSILQRTLDADTSRPDIVVNAICPGYVDTDMTSHKGKKTIDEGADSPLYCALLPPNTKEPRGQFVSERKVEDWTTPRL